MMCLVTNHILAQRVTNTTTMPHAFDLLLLDALANQRRQQQAIEQQEQARLRRRRRRRVTFQDAQVVSEVTPASCMSEEERSRRWLRQSDMTAMKKEARDLSRRMRTEPNFTCTEEFRGLEQRSSFERQKLKFLTIRAIVKAQTWRHPDELAEISSRCSAWASELAILVGRRDYYDAYHPSLAQAIPTTPRQTFLLKKEQNQVVVIDDDDDEGEPVRRVRPRLAPPQHFLGITYE